MNTSVLTEPVTYTVELPSWLQKCLLDHSENSHYLHQDNDLVCRAFNFAYSLHEGQLRKSGEPYIAHPIAVANLLYDLGGDSTMIAAGFLHDVVEDTETTFEEIEEKFGTQVRQLVDGVTKLSKFEFSSKTERLAENFRRMFVAMAKDKRVIVVKLADRLHNMRTLQYLAPEKQKVIALETRDIFAPLANRLGIWQFKWELEDLAFKYLEPEAYKEIQTLISERRVDREAKLEKVINIIRNALEKLKVNVIEIKGRPKHLYGIHHKMERQKKGFDQIYDIAGLRIIVETEVDCYTALAVAHGQFTHIPKRFKDYISLPKPNKYQSIHTSVIGLNGHPLEIQIRSLKMHHVAEYGIAAHWKYKETGNSETVLNQYDQSWLKQLIEWQNELKDAQEYMQGLKDNLFEDDVYVFTPNGDVIALATDATPVDFAYHIHTEIGNHIKGAKVNGEWSVLNRVLENGDLVEIITSKNSHPSLDWLNFVVTPTARNRIRQWFKRYHREENILRGRNLLEKELGKTGFDALLKSSLMQTVSERCNYQKVDDLLAALGYGEITLNHLVNRIREESRSLQEKNDSEQSEDLLSYISNRSYTSKSNNKEPINGVEGLLYNLAGCCHPLPGNQIIGVVTRNARGISIHNQSCSNVENVESERIIPVSWNLDVLNGYNNNKDNKSKKKNTKLEHKVPEEDHNSKDNQANKTNKSDDKSQENQLKPMTFAVDIQIEVIDRVGVFKDVLARLSDNKINVAKAGVKTRPGKSATIYLTMDIQDQPQLDFVVGKIKKMTDILNLYVRRVRIS